MQMHLGQMFMFPLSAVHRYQTWIRKDLECHNTQTYSKKCIDMLHLSGIFSLQKILHVWVTSDLSEAGRYYSHFRDGKPKAWEKTWRLVVWCPLATSTSCRWSLLFSAPLKIQTVAGLSKSAVAVNVKARIRTLRILTSSEHCYRALIPQSTQALA